MQMVSARVLATAFGLLMVASVALQADAPALAAAVVATAAVLGAVRIAALATVAVLAAGAALALSDAGAILAALAGLSATCFLAVRLGGRGMTPPTLVAVFGASALGLLATTLPVEVPWLPLVAPVAVLGAFALAVRGLLDSA